MRRLIVSDAFDQDWLFYWSTLSCHCQAKVGKE